MGGADEVPPLPPSSELKKSDSIGGSSVRSHQSIRTTGAFISGSLYTVNADREPEDDDDDDEKPPPLDPPANQSVVDGPHRHRRESSTSSLSHDMGGGDVALISDLDETFDVGYDSISFTANDFAGIRDVPPGPHLFWVAHRRGHGIRSGFWVYSTGRDAVHVMQWDKFNEVLVQSSRAMARIAAAEIGNVHAMLPSYADPSAVNRAKGDLTGAASDRNLEIWEQLTSSITKDVLIRIIGDPSGDWPVHTDVNIQGERRMSAEMKLDNLGVNRPLVQARQLSFRLAQTDRFYSTEQTGAHRTLYATDATPYLLSFLDTANNDKPLTEDDIVGELQFAYVVGMHLGNESCIEQWWHIVLRIVLRAYLLIECRPSLAAMFLRTLATQITYGTSWLESSIFDYSESNTNSMRVAMTVYKRRLDDILLQLGTDVTADQLTVGTAFSGVEAAIAALGWDIRGDFVRVGKYMMEDGEEIDLEAHDLVDEDERGEWAPEIVSLDKDGWPSDLVSFTD